MLLFMMDVLSVRHEQNLSEGKETLAAMSVKKRAQ